MYGLKPHDIFEANDLFENGNMTQVQTTLLALASMVSLKSLDVFYIMSVIESVVVVMMVSDWILLYPL